MSLTLLSVEEGVVDVWLLGGKTSIIIVRE